MAKDINALREELRETLDEAEWTWLRTHAARGALILVDPKLDLLEVAVRVASDEAAQVGAWIEKGSIAKPTVEQLTDWNRTPERRFLSVVVQPYVLIQELSS
jgi:hypothetical protein